MFPERRGHRRLPRLLRLVLGLYWDGGRPDCGGARRLRPGAASGRQGRGTGAQARGERTEATRSGSTKRPADRLRARPIQRGGDPQSWADQALVNKPMNDLIRKSIADANTDDDLEDIPDPWAGLKRTLAVASGRKRTKRPK